MDADFRRFWEEKYETEMGVIQACILSVAFESLFICVDLRMKRVPQE
jgi:hypothetical protein